MKTTKVEPYDFSKPIPFAVELEHRLVDWLQDACELAPKSWAKHLAFPVELSFHELEVLRQGDSLNRIPDSAIGYRVPVQGGTMISMLALSRPLMLALVTGMLGDVVTELPPDRELTVVEESLAQFLMEDHLVAALQETWQGAEPIRFGPLKKEPYPKYTRIFPKDEKMAVCSFNLQGPFGRHDCFWLAPQKNLVDLIMPTGTALEASKEMAGRQRLEPLVCELPVELTVLLGSIEMPFAQLVRLRPGDVLKLNQPVTEPLTALVAGEKKFQVWPGRVGSRPAFQIESSIGG